MTAVSAVDFLADKNQLVFIILHEMADDLSKLSPLNGAPHNSCCYTFIQNMHKYAHTHTLSHTRTYHSRQPEAVPHGCTSVTKHPEIHRRGPQDNHWRVCKCSGAKNKLSKKFILRKSRGWKKKKSNRNPATIAAVLVSPWVSIFERSGPFGVLSVSVAIVSQRFRSKRTCYRMFTVANSQLVLVGHFNLEDSQDMQSQQFPCP